MNGTTTKQFLEIVLKEIGNTLSDESLKVNVNYKNVFFKPLSELLWELDDIVLDQELNDSIEDWENILKLYVDKIQTSNSSDAVKAENYLVFSYFVVNEIAAQGGGGAKARKLKSGLDLLVEKYLDRNPESQDLKNKINIYKENVRFRLLNARVNEVLYAASKSGAETVLADEERRIEKIRSDLDETREVVDSLQNKVGFTSLFEGFNAYASELKGKIKEVDGEIKRLRNGMLVVPAFAFIIAFFGARDLRFFLALSALIVVLGLMMKVALKRRDQYEQIVAKIENKLAISVFHRYQVKELAENQRDFAQEKFHSFIYSEIETSEWQVPDIADGLVKVAKEFKGNR